MSSGNELHSSIILTEKCTFSTIRICVLGLDTRLSGHYPDEFLSMICTDTRKNTCSDMCINVYPEIHIDFQKKKYYLHNATSKHS